MNDNTQELDEILENLTTAASDDQFIDDGSIGDAKVDILDWHNKQVEAVLDRIDYHTSRTYPEHDDIMDAIEAERNKLKERTNDQL